MTIDEIRELIQVVNETGIAELTVQRGGDSVTIVRERAPSQAQLMPVQTMVPVVGTAAPLPAVAAPALPPVADTPAEIAASSESTEPDVIVKSPIVGTYYDAPSPDAPKFVKVGDQVEPKQVLCIIESMKLMNEIEAETAGILTSKYIDNGRPVEYGESLFSIRPLKS